MLAPSFSFPQFQELLNKKKQKKILSLDQWRIAKV